MKTNTTPMPERLLLGFGNIHASESLPGALPLCQNSPQKNAHQLFAEQISGSGFGMKRHRNFKTWVYRKKPSVVRNQFKSAAFEHFLSFEMEAGATVEPLRWDPFPKPKTKVDFLSGVFTVAIASGVHHQNGCATHVYHADVPMKSFFINHDGEMLFVPQKGELILHTEMGTLHVPPTCIAVIPKGILFQVDHQTPVYGYVCENYGLPFVLPELGVLGANGLANPLDFVFPNAHGHEGNKGYDLYTKHQGEFFVSHVKHHPLDVVAWKGNYAPYVYDLKKFNTLGTVSFDHPDPSIFTVLSSPSEFEGLSNVDFVIFPPRWMVAEHTFRPPYFHRNCMSEIMGLIEGVYDAKEKGFIPGGLSLHNAFTPHGPDVEAFEKATAEKLTPKKLDHTLAFMFETRFVFTVTHQAKTSKALQKNYAHCWSGF